MVESVKRATLIQFLKRIGERCLPHSEVMLLGGAALVLLGGARPTIDIDYVGSDLHPTTLQHLITSIADEMNLDVEAVPIDTFIPMPSGAADRAIPVEQFGNLRASILDPYTIALTKLARGFDSDIEDVVFLIRRDWIDMDSLIEMVRGALEAAESYEIDPAALQNHLQAVQDRLA